jgi:hypothetical protein
MNCPYCNISYKRTWFITMPHRCKDEDLEAEQKRWQSKATIQIGDEKMTVQEIVEMVQWVKREMKK